MTNSPDGPPPAAGGLAFLRQELAPFRGRFANAARIAVLAVLVVVISETFRIPLPAYSAYIVFFASKEETVSTALTGVILTFAATAAILATLAAYMISAGEPGLRLPLIALVTFSGLYLSRVSRLGPASFAAGFVATIALTLIDVIPDAGDLTEMVLWLWVVAMLPIGLVVIANLLTGADPRDLFTAILETRLRLASEALKGDAAALHRLARTQRSGLGGLLRTLTLSGMAHRHTGEQSAGSEALVARVHEITVLVVEWGALARRGNALKTSAALSGEALATVALSVADRRDRFLAAPSVEPDAWDEDPVAALLLTRLAGIVAQLPGLLADRRHADRRPGTEGGIGQKPAARHFLAPDALTDPRHWRFALKVTLCVILAYVAYNLMAWPGIRTAMITCFFVTVGNLGETTHKMALRLTGAVIGGCLGLATIIFLMPLMDGIGDLALVIGIVSFLAAWISVGGEKLSYAGMQIAMAFFFCVLVGYGPTVDLTEARDRVIGVLLGNLIVWVVFSGIWPVSALTDARRALARAVGRMQDVLSIGDTAAGRRPGLADKAVFAFDAALAEAWRLLSYDLLEPKTLRNRVNSPLGPADADRVQSLLAPVLIVAGEVRGAAQAEFHKALAQWLGSLTGWLGTGGGGREGLAPPPDGRTLVTALERRAEDGSLPEDRRQRCLAEAEWYRELVARVAVLDGAARVSAGAAS